MKNVGKFIQFLMIVLLATMTNKIFAYTGADLCTATYTRNYSLIKTILDSGVDPDQLCSAKAPWDLRRMSPSPIFILTSEIKGFDLSNKLYIQVNQLTKQNIEELVTEMLNKGASPNFISNLTKSYKTTNFIASIHSKILSTGPDAILDLMIHNGADVHLLAMYTSPQFICENSPIGFLMKSDIDQQTKNKYISLFKSLGANECPTN